MEKFTGLYVADVNSVALFKKRLDKFWADQNDQNVWLDCWYNRNRRSIGVYSRTWLESLEEVVNKGTDKEAHAPASVFIIADCWF